MGLMDKMRSMGLIGKKENVGSIWETWKTFKYVVGGDQDIRTLIAEYYEKNALIYSCVEELANSASEPRLIVEVRKNSEWVPMENHPLQNLLDMPNKQMTSFEFWHTVMMYECIHGNMYFEKVRSRTGRVVQLSPIRPDRMTAKFTEDGRKMTHWEADMGHGETVDLRLEDVIHFRKPGPKSQVYGLGPLSVCLRMAGIDNNQTDFITAFFDNAAVPFGLLSAKNRLDEAEVQRVREMIRKQYQGSEGWHEIMIVDTDASYQKLGAGLDQIDVTKISALPESRICMAFQVPPILVGALVGLEHATYSNYKEARKHFWEETLMPAYRRHADVVNLHLSPEFGSDVWARWDYGEVSALKEDVNAAHARVMNDFKAGYITINEARIDLGLEELPGQDVFLRPLNVFEVPIGGKEAKQRFEIETLPFPQLKEGDSYNGQRDYSWWKSLDVTAKAWEEPFRKEAASRFREEEEGLLSILKREGKSAKVDLPFQIFLLSALDFLKADGDEWRKGFFPLFEGLLTAQGENIAARFGITFDIATPEVQQFLQVYTMRFSERLFDVSERAINQLVRIAQDEGWTVPQLRDAIQSTWGDYAKIRAEAIARTETIRSSNAGAKASMKEADIKLIKWLTAAGACDWCGPLDGKTIDIDGNFFAKGDSYTVTDAEGKEHSMKIDYEDVGYPPLHPNCRCTITAVIEEV